MKSDWRQRFVESPLPLALLRIVVPLVIVISPELYAGPSLAAAPERFTSIPEGLGLLARIPFTPGLVRALQVIALSTAATAILGYFTRASLVALTIAGGIVFSFSQRSGAVVHDMHLFWFTALLAASPCADAWSLDAWREPRPAPSIRYGAPLAIARLMLGVVYFFPGLHKLRESGIAWTSSANVIGHMHAKWLEHGRVPALRIDHVPWMCAVGGAFVLAFELSFVVLAASRRTRILALALGLGFHGATELFFFIRFLSIYACYVVLVDGAWLERRFPARERESTKRPLVRASVIVGVLLFVPAVIQGARGRTDAWPFACYPTFSHLQGDRIPDIVVEIVRADGSHDRITGRERGPRSQAEWGRVFRLSGAYGPPDPIALETYAREVAGASTPVAVWRVDVPTEPERWSERLSDRDGGTLLLQIRDGSPSPSPPR